LRILLTGSDGFTGREFAHSAAAAGHETIALSADLTRADAVQQELASLQVDAVVHLAAISFVGHADAHAFYDVNLFGTLNLLDALRKSPRPPGKVLLASSANVYGNCEQSPIAETQVPAPVNHYAMSKLAMEHMARAHAGPLPLVITRPFNYTGPGQAGQFVIPKLVDHFRRRLPTIAMGNLHVEREYNDVRFVCECYLRLLDAAQVAGTYNICTGTTYSFEQILDALQRLTGHSIEVRVDPAFVRANEVHRLCGDPSRLQRAIGTLPAFSLDDTLARMLAEPL
jgi:nucleoside-diphosphate-sugar epimerase